MSFVFLLTVGNGSWVDEETFWAPARGGEGESHEQHEEREYSENSLPGRMLSYCFLCAL